MYSAAIFESDVNKLVNMVLPYIPEASPFREGLTDVIAWHKQYPDWKQTRKLIFDKYYRYRKGQYQAPVSDVSALSNGLFGIMAIAIPVIIHLFNFRRFRKILFSNVAFLKEIRQETQKNLSVNRIYLRILYLPAFHFYKF